MKLYAVTNGEYSDYHIVTLQADKKKAKRIAAVLSARGDEYDVEEYESDDWETDPRPVWMVSVYGDVIKGEAALTEGTREAWEKGFFFRKNLRFCKVKARTADEAMKIVADKIAEEKAKEAGL